MIARSRRSYRWERVGWTAAVGVALLLLAAPPVYADGWQQGAVAADHPLASEAGLEILRAGGNAADAAVTVALVLGVVNPFASGMGGGGFALWRGADGSAIALDFRETAPAAASRTMYLDAAGTVIPGLSSEGGLAVGTPGEVAGLFELHRRWGRLPWADVVAPAARIAREGFVVNELLPQRLRMVADLLERTPSLAAPFRDGDGWIEAGDTLQRTDLADALDQIAADGPDAFYRGAIADDIVASVAAAGGVLTADDLAAYAVREREPLVSAYHGHTLLTMPPPSSGGSVIASVLRALDGRHLDRVGWESAATVHVVSQAFAGAFADRALHLGDDRFVTIDWEAVLGEARTRELIEGYDPAVARDAAAWGPVLAPPVDGGTSHFSIVDPDGNAVALTTTVNTIFGSGVVTPRFGIVLNNQMDDFAAAPGVPNAFGLVGSEANAIEAGKTPLSSMSPTIVLREDATGTHEVVGVLGASGGPQIITATVLGILQAIDHQRSPEQIVSQPRFHHQWLPDRVLLEDGVADSVADSLSDLGYTVVRGTFTSALQMLWRLPDGWAGASDPRKFGAAVGF